MGVNSGGFGRSRATGPGKESWPASRNATGLAMRIAAVTVWPATIRGACGQALGGKKDQSSGGAGCNQLCERDRWRSSALVRTMVNGAAHPCAMRARQRRRLRRLFGLAAVSEPRRAWRPSLPTASCDPGAYGLPRPPFTYHGRDPQSQDTRENEVVSRLRLGRALEHRATGEPNCM
jgi:hypothetical protein